MSNLLVMLDRLLAENPQPVKLPAQPLPSNNPDGPLSVHRFAGLRASRKTVELVSACHHLFLQGDVSIYAGPATSVEHSLSVRLIHGKLGVDLELSTTGIVELYRKHRDLALVGTIALGPIANALVKGVPFMPGDAPYVTRINEFDRP